MKPLEKPFEVKPFEIITSRNEFFNQPCNLREHQIHVTNQAYHHFIRALELYAWKYLFPLDERKNYTTIVGALDSNNLFEKEKKEFFQKNSTWLHFDRNIQNLIAIRPLEFARHRKDASKYLLTFFQEIGVIGEPHPCKLYLKKNSETNAHKK